jgi:hypothetical protein
MVEPLQIINYIIVNYYYINFDRLCGLMVRIPGYTTEMYSASCEERTEFINVM